MKKIIIGADHAGFELKELLKNNLEKKGYSLCDVGAKEYVDTDDYPEYAIKVAEKVTNSRGKYIGVIVCGSGAGICIVANKVPGIRAVVVHDEYEARTTREHNDANIICLKGRNCDYELSDKILDIWLNTPFSYEQRHIRRIKQISQIEKKYFKE